MKYPFSYLKTYLANRLGFNTFTNLSTLQQTQFMGRLNELYERVWFHKNWSFSSRKLQLTTIPPYSTGSISGSAGSRTLTGASTSWTQTISGVPLRGQFILVGARLYKIQRFVSSTSLLLEAPLVEDIASGSSYKIYFIEYPIRWDVGALREAKRDDVPLDIRPEAITPVANDEGSPDLLYAASRSEEDFYSTGTVSLTNGSATATFSGATLTTDMIGMAFLVLSDGVIYHILDVNTGSGTATLDKVWRSSSASAQTYAINPVGTQYLGLKPYPSNRFLIQVEYTFQPDRLVQDNDYTLLPSDVPLLVGIDVMATKWESVGEKGFINEVIFQDKKFRDSLKTLNFRVSPLQKRLYTATELHQKSNFLRDTNPWNRR